MSKRRMHSPMKIQGEGIAVVAGRVRLPPGERYQVIHLSPGTIQYDYGGGVVSGGLYASVMGASPIMLHPGPEVYIQLLQAIGTFAFIHIVGSIPDDPNEYGWED